MGCTQHYNAHYFFMWLPLTIDHNFLQLSRRPCWISCRPNFRSFRCQVQVVSHHAKPLGLPASKGEILVDIFTQFPLDLMLLSRICVFTTGVYHIACLEGWRNVTWPHPKGRWVRESLQNVSGIWRCVCEISFSHTYSYSYPWFVTISCYYP